MTEVFMKEFLSSGVVGNIEYNAQKQIRESIQHRWDELGFTIDWASLLRI